MLNGRLRGLVEAGKVRLLLKANPEAISKVVDLKTLYAVQENRDVAMVKSSFFCGAGLCDAAVLLMLWNVWTKKRRP